MWIARDKDGTLSFFVIRPVRYNGNWVESDASPSIQDSCTIPKSLFPELKWEDDAMEVELKPKSKVDLDTLGGLLDKALSEETKESWLAKEAAYRLSVAERIDDYTKQFKENEENERIYYFDGTNPTYDEWVKAGIALGYGDSESDFNYENFAMLRGDLDYTR